MIRILVEYNDALLGGLKVTLELTVVSTVIGLFVGTILGVLAARFPSFFGRCVQTLGIATAGTPILVALFWFHYPAQSIFGAVLPPFLTALFTLSLYSIVLFAELIRTNVADFPTQYMTTARVYGLKDKEIFINIVLPMLLRQMLPGFMNIIIFILQATLFASLISVNEIFRVAQRINSTVYRPVEVFTSVALFFLAICVPLHIVGLAFRKHYTRDYSAR